MSDMTEMAPKTASVISMVECMTHPCAPLDLSRVKVGSHMDPIVGLVLNVERVVDCLGSAVIA
jgi:hypothetical protein